jgi:hypothetical protein
VRFHHPLRVALSVVCLLIAQPGLMADPMYGCIGYIKLQNLNRRVWGPVNGECSGDLINCFPIPPFGHTVPWGNWGVNSNLNSKSNDRQYSGWRMNGDHEEWNTCTSEFPPPDGGYYNYQDDTTQTTDVGEEAYATSGTFAWNEFCTVYQDYVITIEGNYVDLYELDPCDEDEYIASMTYQDMSVTLSCTGSGVNATCTAESGWVDPSSINPNVVTAQARLKVDAHFGRLPGT